jgi:type VI secretion system protein ImpL
MRSMGKISLVVGSAYLVYAAAAYFLASALGPEGRWLWLVRGALWLLGAVVAVLVGRRLLTRGAPAAGAGDELGPLFAAARRRLVEARLRPDALPVVLVAGPSGSAKTTVLQHAGLEPELLAGEGVRPIAPAPTATANLWYGGRALVVEAGGRWLGDAARWERLGHLLRLPWRRTAFSGSAPPRVAVVCVGCDELMRPGGVDALGQLGRQLRERLGELARGLGTQLPVYVLFTKADLLPHFTEYVQGLPAADADQVLGATLPIEPAPATGWADHARMRIQGAMDGIFRGLAGRRLELLEHAYGSESGGAVYEFPRTFRKLGPAVQELLVELARPSSLQVSLFLRGFYFTGVRPVTVDDAPLVDATAWGGRAAHAPVRAAAVAADATAVFHDGAGMLAAPSMAHASPFGPPPLGAPAGGGRRVPHWTFLRRIFSDVVLVDATAHRLGRAAARVNAPRRALLGAAAAAALAYAGALVVSGSHCPAASAPTRRPCAASTPSGAASPGSPSGTTTDRRCACAGDSTAATASTARSAAPTSAA